VLYEDCGNDKMSILDIADYPAITCSISKQPAFVTDQGFPTGAGIVQGGDLVFKIINIFSCQALSIFQC